MGNRQVIDTIIQGKRLSQPPLIPVLFNRILGMCWEQNPTNRPTTCLLFTTLRLSGDQTQTPPQENFCGGQQNVYEDNLVMVDALNLSLRTYENVKSLQNMTEAKAFIDNVRMKAGDISVDWTWNIRAIDASNRRKFELQDCFCPPRPSFSDFVVGDLKTCLRNRSINENDKMLLVDICRQITDALRFFNEKAYIIHRNLRAQSCLVRAPSNTVVVCDFGLAQFVEGEDRYVSSKAESVPLRWCAPEVLRQCSYSTKSDIWALGILFWEVFSGGKMPFKELTNGKLASMMINENVPPPLQFPDSCPGAIQDIIQLCCSLDTGCRPKAHSIFNALLKINELKTWDENVELQSVEVFPCPKRIAFTAVFSQTPLMLCPKECILGDLQYWLHSGQLENVEEHVKLSLCLQVFSALQFMCEQQYILHRHITADNCLIATDGKLKLCDGGLARKVQVDYYSAVEENSGVFDRRLPLRYCAPETLQMDSIISTTKSDVWMAAVLCWTIYNKGKITYHELGNNQTAALAILKGRRLQKNVECPQSVFDLLSKCWATDPGDRPSAAEMVDWLSKVMREE